MIVAEVNVLAYLYFPGPHSDAAEALLLRDAEWMMPRLWRSEFRNVLTTYMRQGRLTLESAMDIYQRAQALVGDNEYEISALAVLRLAKESGCSAYDCEYLALAEHLDVSLVSADKKLCKAFPMRAVSLSES